MKKNIAIILSGCGNMDGAEIHESTCTLLSIDERDASYQCFALDAPMGRVMNFVTATEETTEKRNQLQEAARIARGNIKPLTELNVSDFDALILPGGFGVAHNLCNFAQAGTSAQVNPLVAEVLLGFQQAQKPIGAICISPILLALVFGTSLHPTLTLGEADDPAALAAAALGCTVLGCAPDACIIDSAHKIITSPAYMNATRIAQVRCGVDELVKAVLEMVV